MYSRYHNPSGKTVQIPDNYSGCAFAEPKVHVVSEKSPAHREHFTPPTDVRRVEVAKPTLPDPAPTLMPISQTPPQKESKPKEAPANQSQPPTLPASGLFGNLGKHLPLSQGLGFEELLLLGLILLLSQTEQSSDIVLWLALLLFCG